MLGSNGQYVYADYCIVRRAPLSEQNAQSNGAKASRAFILSLRHNVHRVSCNRTTRGLSLDTSPCDPTRKVYTAPASQPWAKVSRLLTLFERNPDTMLQLSHQDEVARRQRAGREGIRPDAAESDSPSDEAPSSRTTESGGSKAALLFVAGDRSQVGITSFIND